MDVVWIWSVLFTFNLNVNFFKPLTLNMVGSYLFNTDFSAYVLQGALYSWHCYVHKLPRCLPQGALMIDTPLYVSPLELQGIQNFFLTTCPQGPQKRK